MWRISHIRQAYSHCKTLLWVSKNDYEHNKLLKIENYFNKKIKKSDIINVDPLIGQKLIKSQSETGRG